MLSKMSHKFSIHSITVEPTKFIVTFQDTYFMGSYLFVLLLHSWYNVCLLYHESIATWLQMGLWGLQAFSAVYVIVQFTLAGIVLHRVGRLKINSE